MSALTVAKRSWKTRGLRRMSRRPFASQWQSVSSVMTYPAIAGCSRMASIWYFRARNCCHCAGRRRSRAASRRRGRGRSREALLHAVGVHRPPRPSRGRSRTTRARRRRRPFSPAGSGRPQLPNSETMSGSRPVRFASPCGLKVQAGTRSAKPFAAKPSQAARRWSGQRGVQVEVVEVALDVEVRLGRPSCRPPAGSGPAP